MKKLFFFVTTIILGLVNLFGQTVTYQSAVDPTQRVLSTSLAVGSTDGSAGVSNMGAATYSIPIFVSPGTHGLQPSLSINYNSHSGNGFLGMGWYLAGLPVITREGQNIYTDGQVKGLELSANDRFVFDGNRLIVTNGKTYGSDGAIYHTQNESGVQITSHGTLGSGPSWFTVQTKDGVTMEFGNSSNSILQAQNQNEAVFWYVNKITDANGNYMTFTYHSDRTTGEFYPVEIDYTGNTVANTSPYNSIKFNYVTRTSDIKTSYIAGSPIIQAELLSTIQALNGTNVVREYDFKYAFDVITHLNEVVEYGSDKSYYNSTVFSYYGYTKNYMTQYATSLPINSTITGGDFYGNGEDQVIVKGNLYALNSAGNNFTLVTASAVPNGTIVTGDFNGDGKVDIIEPVTSSTNDFAYYKSNGTTFTSMGRFGTRSQADASSPDVYAEDINGDGIKDVFVHDPLDGSLKVYWGNASTPFTTSTTVSLTWGVHQYWGDFDGNGKMDLMTTDGTGYRIYEWEASSASFVQKISGSDPTSSDIVVVGDFNGDGKTDFLSGIVKAGFSIMYSNISTGSGFIRTNFGYSFSSSALVSSFDIDGDGADELLCYNSSNKQFYYYKFNNFVYTSHFNDTFDGPILSCNDFNGDGIEDVLFQNPSDTLVTVVFNESGNTKNFLSDVANGLNRKIHFNYKPLSDPSVLTSQLTPAYPAVPTTEQIYVVSSSTSDNGIGGSTEEDYTYQGATDLLTNGGFSGFTKTTATNDATLAKSIVYNTINSTYCFIQPQKTEQYANNTLVGQKTYTMTVTDLGNKRILPYISKVVTNSYDLGTKSLYNSITENYSYDNDGNMLNHYVNYDNVASTNT